MNLKKYDDIDRAITYVVETVEDDAVKREALLMLNELWALRNSHEVMGVRNKLERTESSTPERGEDGKLLRRMGIFDPDMTEVRDVEDAIVLSQIANRDFIVVKSESVAAKFFAGEYAKKPPKKSVDIED